MGQNDDQIDRSLLLPRLLLAIHALVAILTVVWGVLDSLGSPASAYFKLSYSLGLPRVVGNTLELIIYFLTIPLFPIASLVVMPFLGARRIGPYFGCHCGLSFLQFMGFIPLVA